MNIAIIKYNAGNIRSVDFALNRLGVNAKITGDHSEIKAADKVIFPGVGEASTTMQYLNKSGLDKLIPSLTQPVLGICLGMQLMCSHSEEGDVDCLGIFNEKVKLFIQDKPENKIPHMGWNALGDYSSNLFDGFTIPEYVYFVHSYYVAKGEDTAATCKYITPYSASLHKSNFYATQFHPEKSGPVGARILKNFIEKC